MRGALSLVIWNVDSEACRCYDDVLYACKSLINAGYVSLHLATDLQSWNAGAAKNVAGLCAGAAPYAPRSIGNLLLIWMLAM